MMRGRPSMVLVTTMVSCLNGFEESQSDATVSAGGAVSEKNRWRLDAGDNRLMNDCIIGWSSALAGRRDAVVPSRNMTDPDSGFPETGGGWNNGRICFMPDPMLELLQAMSRFRGSFRLVRAFPGLRPSQDSPENSPGCWLRQVRRAAIV